MIYYSESTVNELFRSDPFKEACCEYAAANDDLIKLAEFIDTIQLNKKYFRLDMNNKNGRKKKYKKTSQGSDSDSLKEINSLLNKLTDTNIMKIRDKVAERVVGKEYLMEMIIESIMNKCIVHCPYIPIYLELIQFIYPDSDKVNPIIEKISDNLYIKINDSQITAETEYLIMCEKNKKLDNLIGHSILITELEKMKIINGRIHHILKNFINVLSECDSSDEKYKCVQCLYNVFKSFYGRHALPTEYTVELMRLIDAEESKKIMYKMLDIVERK